MSCNLCVYQFSNGGSIIIGTTGPNNEGTCSPTASASDLEIYGLDGALEIPIPIAVLVASDCTTQGATGEPGATGATGATGAPGVCSCEPNIMKIVGNYKYDGVARWQYDVIPASRTNNQWQFDEENTQTAFNLLEYGNNENNAYGVAVGSDGIFLPNTQFSIRPVPNNTLVSVYSIGEELFFLAPNYIDGTC